MIEVFFKFLCGDSVFNWSLLRILISTSFISVLISFICSYLKNIVSMIVNIIITLGITIYAFAQLGFNNYLGVYMSLNTTSQFGAVVDYIGEYFRSFKITYYLIFIPLILLILYYIFLNKKLIIEIPKLNKNEKIKSIIKKVSSFLLLEISIGFIYFSTLVMPFMQNKYQLQSNKSLFVNPSVPSIAIKQLGVVTFGLGDVRIKFFPVDETMTSIDYQKSEKEKTDYSRIIDDTAFEKVIESEKNKTYQNLNNYFISQDITDKNEYTGMFEGKNVIVIMMESVNDIIINEELYPNFYKLYSEGWHWENNYSPRNSCATGNNELSGMTGLYSIYNSCTANVYKNNTYFTSIFNLFNNAGYYTSSMHNYTEAYYYRSRIHTNLGSQKYYGVQSLGIPYRNEYRNWASDADFMSKYLEIIDTYEEGKPFMTWLTTVSSHQPYSVSSILGDKYLSEFKDYDYPTDLKRYMSKLKELDLGFGILINGLEERGILDDTVIVMYGDHYPYGLSNKTINHVLDYPLEDYEAERVPFVIYNSELEAKTFTEYTSYVNIVPTIANLCDLEYDPRFYNGTDLLSKNYESMVVFADGSWKNEFAYYNASNSSLTQFEEGYYSEEDITRINEEIHLKISMSNSAIKTNYFGYLEKALNNKKEELNIMENDDDVEELTKGS
ncbi:MAG: LTA synthase family protein [Bacilli bacterium]|nr:LTA synthase family protein [Bacilli bacterium]